ncbi:pyruvate formate lyase activating enzyme [Thermotomaculum hydrothermale]|uniref:Pyruvate formate lyase activating enzyme n=1 Tax=Thermotomaculum hydrothermale TaxID=981385 RepID=A0A7R6SXX9_9BACT|nr:AmmeMemoRadiSam system radical SAM enzyme [Thermotomaculum hydrothermale]BBB31981.1 pyruvate formate lyase activating enzyme [Thermotomaculum hydrothermale]
MFEAKYYEKLENKKVRCTLCPHYCTLKEGQTGICRVRKNINGILYSLSYQNIIAMHIDPIEKKPLYHFSPGARTLSIATPGCNFHCLNCQNHTISQIDESIFDFTRKIPPEEVVKIAISENIKHITFTYTEPTIFFEYMLDTAKIAKKEGLYCSIVSNGYITKEPLKELIPFIDAANIDFKFHEDSLYRKIAGGKAKPVLETIKTLYHSGVITEVTTLIIPEVNDNDEYFLETAKSLLQISNEIPWHLSAFYPTYKMIDYQSTRPETLVKFRKLAIDLGFKFVYTGNILDLEGSTTYCPKCGEALIKRHYFNLTFSELKENKCPKCGEFIYGKFQ